MTTTVAIAVARRFAAIASLLTFALTISGCAQTTSTALGTDTIGSSHAGHTRDAEASSAGRRGTGCGPGRGRTSGDQAAHRHLARRNQDRL